MSNALQRLIAERKASMSRDRPESPKDGRNRYRILPSWRRVREDGTLMTVEEAAKFAPAHLDQEGKEAWAETFYADFGQHFLKDASGAVKAVALCADKTFGKPCQICDELSRGLAAVDNEQAEQRLKDAQSGGRILLNVLALDTPNPDTPVLLAIAPSCFNGKKGVGGIVSLFTDWPNMLDLAAGADIIIEKSGKGLDTAYGVSAVPGKPVDPKVMAKVKNIDKFIANEANPQGLNRAIAHVSTMTGLLPAPSAPSLTDAAAQAFSTAPIPSKPTQAEVFQDIPDFPVENTAVAQAVEQPAAQPAAEPTLEELLKGL